jgi:hypothetical protein
MLGENLEVLLLSLQRCWMRAMAFTMRDGHEAADLLWRRRELILFLLLEYGIGASVYYNDEVVPDR